VKTTWKYSVSRRSAVRASIHAARASDYPQSPLRRVDVGELHDIALIGAREFPERSANAVLTLLIEAPEILLPSARELDGPAQRSDSRSSSSSVVTRPAR
jgi:hypothetical protein